MVPSLQEGEDMFSISAKAEFQENCNSRLVDILREENTALKRDLETYYQRVRKLQKVSVFICSEAMISANIK